MSPQGVVGPGIFGPPGGGGTGGGTGTVTDVASPDTSIKITTPHTTVKVEVAKVKEAAVVQGTRVTLATTAGKVKISANVQTGAVPSVAGTAPIKVTPTTGTVGVSWLPTATTSMHTQKLGHLATPTTATQATTKSYVDGLANGLDAKTSAVAVAIANVASLSGPQSIDSVTLVAGNRVLLTGQTTAKTNGLWVVQTLVWTRPTTFALASSQQGAYVFIEEGTLRKGTGWVLTGTAIVVGTTNQTWVKFSTTTTTKVTMGGDVTGTSTASQVVKLLHKVITTLTNGKFLKVTTTKIVSATPPATTKVTMGGGVTGTSTAATVAKAPSGSMTASYGITIATSGGKAVISTTTIPGVAHNTGATLALTDAGHMITVTNATGKTITIPKHATVAFPVSTVIGIAQTGAGQVTVAAGATVTLHSATAKVKTRVRYSVVWIRQTATNVWRVYGDLG